MEDKALWCISGYISTDTNEVEVSIYKQLCLGGVSKRYVWIKINGTGNAGIGTGTDDFWKLDQIESIIQMTKFTDENYLFGQWTLLEMLEEYEKFYNNLAKYAR